MFRILNELPDWTSGALLGGAAWFGVSYTVLAPRALEEDLTQDVYPACVANLETEQDQAIERATEYRRAEIKRGKEDALRAISQKTKEIQEMEVALRAIAAMNSMNEQSGLAFFLPKVPVSDRDLKSLDTARAELNSLKERLKIDVPINFPRVPSGELLNRCGCAAAQAIAGKRTSYAISLASFRMITPNEIGNLKSDINSIVNTDVCGAKQWRNL